MTSVTEHGLSPRVMETLRQLGLTEYGARCYVALLTLRSAEASAVAEAAEVPRTKVYATLKDLVDAGWVVAEAGRPVVYRAVSPEERIAAAEKRIAQDVADATRELQARYANRAEMLPISLYLLRGPAAITAKSVELLARAREEALVNLGFAMEDERPLFDAVEKARRRGVTVHVMAARDIPLSALAQGARIAAFPFRAVVSDWRQVLLTMPSPEPVAVWNPTQVAVDVVAPMLRAAWERAEPYDA